MRKILFAALALCASPAFAADDTDTGTEMAPPEMAAPKIGGLRVEGHIGIERPNLNWTEGNTTYVDSLNSSFAYGAEVGYDIPVSEKVTVGPYAGYDIGKSEKCESAYLDGGFYGTHCFEAKSNMSIGLRAAFASEKANLYAGLGYDVYDFDYSLTVEDLLYPGSATFVDNEDRKGLGVTFGGDYNLSRNAYVGLGFRISEFGEFLDSGANLQRFQGNLVLGFRM